MNKLLKSIIKQYRECKECPLHETAHTHVFYRGDCPCDVLFVGEGPGPDEDMVGLPFIGRAGDLLNDMIDEAKEELYRPVVDWSESAEVKPPFKHGFTNIVCCRPITIDSKIRPPSEDEARACSARYRKTLQAASPKLIILLGQVAKKYHKMPVGLENIPVVHLKHPAAFLYAGGKDADGYDSTVVALTDALEKHLYGSQTTEAQVKDPIKPTVKAKKAGHLKPRHGQHRKVKKQVTKATKRKA